jgi:hypothetical protein
MLGARGDYADFQDETVGTVLILAQQGFLGNMRQETRIKVIALRSTSLRIT